MKIKISDFWQITVTLIPLFAVVISYLCGLNTQYRQHKHEVREKRYYQLYVPYMRLLLETESVWRKSPSSLPPVPRAKLFELFTDNLELMGINSAIAYKEFRLAYIAVFPVEGNGDMFSEKSGLQFDKAFNKIKAPLLHEASRLSKQLHYTDLSTTLSKR